MDERNVLPNIESLIYTVPKMMLYLDQDIKNMWKEQCIIKKEIETLKENNKEKMKTSFINEVYLKFLNTTTGQKYLKMNLDDRTNNVEVCFNCYSFYKELQKVIIDESGNLRLD